MTFNLTATSAAAAANDEAALVAAATSLVAAVAAAEAAAAAAAAAAPTAANNNTTTNKNTEAPFLRDLVTPKHLRYDWEEVHPAQALSNGLVVAAPRNGGGKKKAAATRWPLPAPLRRFVETEAFCNTRAVVMWVSLGAAMFVTATRAFDTLEALTFGSS